MSWPGGSLAGRVAMATALAGALAAALAAFVSWRIATELIDQAEDRRLRESVQIFFYDLELRDASTTLEQAIADELTELGPSSVRFAVYEHAQHVGGDQLGLPERECVATHKGDLVQRVCASSRGGITVVAATTRAGGASRRFILGSVLASLTAAGLAALIGQRVARWAISPLQALTRSLDQVRAEEPSPNALPDARNVPEVELVRDALASLVRRLAASLARARRFSADAAHELRTPLTVLSGQLDLMLDEAPSEQRRAELQPLQSRVRALSRLVERLLVLATSEQNLLKGAHPVALEDVVRHSVEGLAEAERGRVDLQVEAQGVTNGDESLLGVAVDNALDNALKFSGQAPVTLRVTEQARLVLVDVIDHGPGLSEGDRLRAFDAFFRTPGARASGLPGHGIGLALVSQVSRLHGGSCQFLEAPKGAHLRLTLPAWQPRESPTL